ncbi:MAG: hypothetical protein ACXWLH_01440 [Candidatus Saccharimonadales bacterium]
METTPAYEIYNFLPDLSELDYDYRKSRAYSEWSTSGLSVNGLEAELTSLSAARTAQTQAAEVSLDTLMNDLPARQEAAAERRVVLTSIAATERMLEVARIRTAEVAPTIGRALISGMIEIAA